MVKEERENEFGNTGISRQRSQVKSVDLEDSGRNPYLPKALNKLVKKGTKEVVRKSEKWKKTLSWLMEFLESLKKE